MGISVFRSVGFNQYGIKIDLNHLLLHNEALRVEAIHLILSLTFASLFITTRNDCSRDTNLE